MVERSGISSILVMGAGQVVIGQACWLDYSGTRSITCSTG